MNTIDIVPIDKRTPGVKSIDRVLQTNLSELYAKRVRRLCELATDHADEEYLRFAAKIVSAQAHVLAEHPWRPAVSSKNAEWHLRNVETVTPSDFLGDLYWLEALKEIIRLLTRASAQQARETLRIIDGYDKEALADKAFALLRGKFVVDPREAIFIWAALLLQWAQGATGGVATSGHLYSNDEHRHCPLCNCAPSGSVILGDARGGLRYLHCSLCESRWHMVRAKCTCCGGGEHVDYWSIDDQNASIKIETCGDCIGYLKILYTERDTTAELIADDLASVLLDFEAERMGFLRTGINPFAFPVSDSIVQS